MLVIGILVMAILVMCILVGGGNGYYGHIFDWHAWHAGHIGNGHVSHVDDEHVSCDWYWWIYCDGIAGVEDVCYRRVEDIGDGYAGVVCVTSGHVGDVHIADGYVSIGYLGDGHVADMHAGSGHVWQFTDKSLLNGRILSQNITHHVLGACSNYTVMSWAHLLIIGLENVVKPRDLSQLAQLHLNTLQSTGQ